MSRRFFHYGGPSGGPPFDPINLNPQLIFDPEFQWFSDAGITPVVDNDPVVRMNNLGVGTTTFASENTNQIVWKPGTGSTLGNKPFAIVDEGNTLGYLLDTALSISGEFELFCVIQTVAGTGSTNFHVVFDTESNTGRGYLRFDYGSNIAGISVGAGGFLPSQTFLDSTRYILNVSRNSSNLVNVRVEGVSIGTGTHTPSNSLTRMFGRSDNLYHYYYSFFKAAELTATERADMFNFLNTTYV